MNKLRILSGLAVFALVGSIITSSVPVSASTFNPSQIMSDGIFTNTNSMSAVQIDAFLNGFGSSCISANANSNGNGGFLTPDPLGWSASQNQYLYGGNVTAGQAIHDVAVLYSVNPQVILATLQKEQSIITGGAGCHYNSPDPATATPMNDACGSGTRNCTLACTYAGGCMNIALGYGCPNYCNVVNEGFSKQLTLGTWLLRFGQQRAYGTLTGYQGYEAGDETFCYTGPMVAGTRQRSVSTNTSCAGSSPTYFDGTYIPKDSGSISIANGATSTLYNFTPFINGNRSFFNTFEGWFGPANAVKLKGAPGSVSWGFGRLDVFSRGTDDTLWQKYYDGPHGGWGPWSSRNVQIASDPTVSSWASGRLDIFYANSEGSLQHYWYGNGAWQNVEDKGTPAPGVTIVGSPSAESWGFGRIDIMARGSDNALWQRVYDVNLGGWQPWVSIGGLINSAPSVTAWADGRLDVFATGPAGDLEHFWFTDNSWHLAESLGKPAGNITLSTAPGGSSWSAGRLDVFGRGSDGVLWQKWFDSSGWHPWVRFTGVLDSAPSISSWAPSRLDEFSTGPAGDLQHYWFGGGGGWQSWESFGQPVY